MALGIDQQILDQRVDYVVPFETERGGVLSLTTLSGVQYATYEPNPNNDTIPLGIQQYDFEEVDLYRANAPWSTRRAYPAFTPVPYITLGTIVTNAIHPDIDPSTVVPGAPVYLAPSGLITSVTTFSNRRIGRFDSALNDASVSIPARRNSGSFLRVAGHQAIVNPDPVLVATAGWARIRIRT